ncbi:MAG: PadR family transcriptional regulator [Proteobacteria bacterium]|nr:PadR family transcriptional regulator [Pseudomonadota bacterium]
MTKARAALTELEGAILGVLRRAPGMTPYAVRKVFLDSRSAEWSGSAGAVYPAIDRLARKRLLKARAGGDRRGAKTYVLGPAGLAAHDRWLCDAARAASPGIDPFRTRAALWPLLPAHKRKALMTALRREIETARAALLQDLPARDPADAITDRLVLAVLDSRLAWIGRMRAQR